MSSVSRGPRAPNVSLLVSNWLRFTLGADAVAESAEAGRGSRLADHQAGPRLHHLGGTPLYCCVLLLQVLVNGQRMNKAVRRRVGFVLQDDVLYETLTVTVQGQYMGSAGVGQGRALPAAPMRLALSPGPAFCLQETLTYAGLLRLPRTMSRAEKVRTQQ